MDNILLSQVRIVSTWLLIKSGLYSLSRKMEMKAIALKEKEIKKTGIMKADAMRVMREKSKLPGFTKVFDVAQSQGDEEGLRTPRLRGMTSRIGTPRPGRTSQFGALGFDEDIERAQSSRSGSKVRLIR